MSKKYIAQINNDNFVYPNNKLAEYDVEIIHDLKENSVSGTTSGFSILYNTGTGNLQCSFTYTWLLNGAEPYIDNEGKLQILSLHLMGPNKMYFKPWICVGFIDAVNTALTTKSDTQNFIITPQMMNVSSFVNGTYYGEIRFIGRRAIFPISASDYVAIATPTPTPTGTGPTPTPTPSNPCYCYEIKVTGTTGGEGGVIASLVYNDCYGVQTARAFTIGPGTYKQCIQTISGVVQYDPALTYGIDQSYLTIPGVGNCRTGYVCEGYTPDNTPTPTPTPTATGAPTFTPTPTPTPTATGAPTFTPSPTPTATEPPPTPTPTGTPTPTPTPTPTGAPTFTPTPTPTFLYGFSIWKGTAGPTGSACSQTGIEYTVYNELGHLLDGIITYADGLGTTVFAGGNFYYSDGYTYGRISNFGDYASEGNCSI